jgi:DNA-binding response OmpR family regulator
MKPLNILVMEDDAVIAMLLGEVLAAMGHRVCATAATEDDGIMAAARCHPDLLIVDEQLGAGSGVVAVGKILRHEPVPHLFVTANTNSVRALRPDAVVIEKPFSQEQLARALSQVYSPAG